MTRWYGPKKPDHPSIGIPCPFCGVPFKAGDFTGLVVFRTARNERAETEAAGRPYTAEAKEVHRDCLYDAALACAEADKYQ
jgi:hypothetical protein